MIFLLLPILYFSVLFFGGVHYWAIAFCHLLALAGLLIITIKGVRSEKLAIVPSRVYVPIVAGLIFAMVSLCCSPAYFFARKEFLVLSCVCVVFFMTVQWADSASRIRQVVYGVVCIAVAVACYGMYQFYLSPDKTYAVVKPAEYWGRASGSYISPNHFGDLLAVVLPLLVSFFVAGVSKNQPGWKKYIRLIILGTAILIVSYALMLSMSRGSMIAAVLAMLLFFFFLYRHVDTRRMGWICVAIAVLLGGGLCMTQMNPGRASKKTAVGDHARMAVAKDSLTMVAVSPITGHGIGMYRWVFPVYKRDGIRRVVDYAHNDYVHIAAETGILGMLILLSTLILICRQGCVVALFDGQLRIVAGGLVCGLAAGLLHALVDFNLHITANAVLLAIIAGCIVAGYRVVACGGTRYEVPIKNDVAKVAGWIVAFVIFLWMVADARIIAAAYYYDQGERQTAQLSWDGAVTAYRKGFQLDPKNPVIAGKIAELNYKKYIFARSERDLFRDEAVAWYTIAVSLNPYDGEMRVRLADLYQHIGEPEKAEGELHAALRLDPHNGFFHRAYGIYHLKRKAYPQAVKEFEETLRIYPKDDIAQSLLKRAKKQSAGGS